MANSMTPFGCGPKMALISLPYICLSVAVMFIYPEFLNLESLDTSFARIIGYTWGGTGIVFWIWSAIYFLRSFEQGILITKGPFALCRNPIYASIIIFVIPALGMILHSGLIFSIAVVLYLTFKISIHGEVIVLRRIFGEDYDKYEASVNEIFPFPREMTFG